MSGVNAERLRQLERENEELRATVTAKDRFIKEVMGSYVTADVADEILSQEDSPVIGGERRVVTMLISDLRRSTELSDIMDPIDYIKLLNHYLETMILVIDAWQGNILDFVGDAIVAVYGAPRDNVDAAHDAVCSALAMQRCMARVNEWNQAQGYPPIRMGIGIHTGEAIVGTIGSAARMKYDVIGRHVNLASRIEGYAHGGQILVSSETFAAAGETIVERVEGRKWIEPKGIQGKVLVHDVIGAGSLRIPPWQEAARIMGAQARP